MGGAVDRAKSCLTCRKRRVKCDGERPNCHECLSSRIICQGYDALVFVFSHCPSPKRDSSSDQDICLASLSRYFANDSPLFDLYRRCMASAGRSPSNPQNAPLIQQAFVTLATLSYGHLQNDQKIRLSGLTLYSNSTKALANALQHFKKESPACLLVCMLCLLSSERLMCLNDSWKVHSLGLESIIPLINPRLRTTSPVKELLAGLRPLMIGASFGRDLSSLTTPLWSKSQEPNPNCAESISADMVNCILNVYGELSEIFTIRDAFFEEQNEMDLAKDLEFFRDTLSRTLSLTLLLEQKFQTWLAQNKHLIQEAPAAILCEYQVCWQTVFRFQAPEAVQVMPTYNAMLIMLLHVVKLFAGLAPEAVMDSLREMVGMRKSSPLAPEAMMDSLSEMVCMRKSSPLAPLQDMDTCIDTLTRSAAIDICRSVEGFVYEVKDRYALFYKMLPLRASRWVFAFHTSAEGRYLDAAFKLALEHRTLSFWTLIFLGDWNKDFDRWKSGQRHLVF